MKILIAGGGIGGLMAALCLLHHGHDVLVLEKTAELGEVGAGIQVPPNAMKVLETLGLGDALAKTAFRPEAIEARLGQSGLELFNIPLADTATARWGSAYLHIHRADYITVLQQAVRARAPEAIRLGADVASYTQTHADVTAVLSDGTTITGDGLIGADGIHSAIRKTMLGPQIANFTGHVAWRAVVPIERLGKHAPRPTACVWMGRGRHCVTYRLRGGTLANFVGVVERDDWTRESWTERGSREDALSDFPNWHPIIQTLLEKSETLYRWALFDRPPLDRWVDGRVALLGDAAHPMLPFMAQGAAMAVEDAWVMATQLTSASTLSDGLNAYQDLRFDRASDVQAASRANARTFHKQTRFQQIATYGPMWLGSKIAPWAIYRRLDPLYSHDVTTA